MLVEGFVALYAHCILMLLDGSAERSTRVTYVETNH